MNGNVQVPILLVAMVIAMIVAGACGGAAQADAPVSGEIASATRDADGTESSDSGPAADAMPEPAEPQEPSTTAPTSVPEEGEDAVDAKASEDAEAAPQDAEAAGEADADAVDDPSSGPVVWEDIESLTIEIDGDIVRLEDGTAAISYGGASESVFTLQDRAARGDLDGDGDDDFVAHIVEQSPGTGVFHLIVPVFDDGGRAVVGDLVTVGDRIVMDTISVKDGAIEVAVFDRAQDESFLMITRRTTLEIVLTPSAPLVRVISVEPIESLPPSNPPRPDIEVRFDAGATSATERGALDFRERQTYIVEASAGQAFSATVKAPSGVWLDVRLDDDNVLASATERSQHVEAELPATGQWHVTVLSFRSGPVDYELTVEALHADGGDASEDPGGDAAPAPATTAPAVGMPPLILPEDGPVMYFTFDDGPDPTYTPQVLDVLARHGVAATFFVVGRYAAAFPGLIDRIVAEGHTVANHTWNHESLDSLSKESFDSTVGRTQALLGQRATPCLRPPYGNLDASTQRWAAEHGLRLMLWNVDPADWQGHSAETIADHIVRHARPGAVVLLHDGGGDRSGTVAGLDMALQRLAGSGLRYATLCR